MSRYEILEWLYKWSDEHIFEINFNHINDEGLLDDLEELNFSNPFQLFNYIHTAIIN